MEHLWPYDSSTICLTVLVKTSPETTIDIKSSIFLIISSSLFSFFEQKILTDAHACSLIFDLFIILSQTL